MANRTERGEDVNKLETSCSMEFVEDILKYSS